MKNKVALCLFSLLLIISFGANAQQEKNKDLIYLASNKLKGRAAGTKHELAAARYIAKRFEEIGLQPIGDEGGYLQPFSFDPQHMEDPDGGDSKQKKGPLTSHNVLGWIDNGANKTIVIGAHYDHLGMGEYGSLHTGDKEIHNGADDNASGVAALIDLGERLVNTKGVNTNFLFIAFGAEEAGLLGSKHYIQAPVVPNNKISCMINLDMVGRLNEAKELTVYGTGTSPKWPTVLKAAERKELKLKFEESGLGPSDHATFYLSKIPVLCFFTGKHIDYHKPTDDIEKINYEGMTMIVDYVESIIHELDPVLKLAFSETKDEMVHNSPRKKYKVTLGVMPDYAFQGPGMRIDGVIGNRPADKAGMQDGDVVIQLGEVEVRDLQTYMEALSQFNAGDKTKVVFERAGNKMELELEF
jgi:hypothetical protein